MCRWFAAGRPSIEGDKRNSRVLRGLDRRADGARVEGTRDDHIDAGGDQVVDVRGLLGGIAIGDVFGPLKLDTSGLSLSLALRPKELLPRGFKRGLFGVKREAYLEWLGVSRGRR